MKTIDISAIEVSAGMRVAGDGEREIVKMQVQPVTLLYACVCQMQARGADDFMEKAALSRKLETAFIGKASSLELEDSEYKILVSSLDNIGKNVSINADVSDFVARVKAA